MQPKGGEPHQDVIEYLQEENRVLRVIGPQNRPYRTYTQRSGVQGAEGDVGAICEEIAEDHGPRDDSARPDRQPSG